MPICSYLVYPVTGKSGELKRTLGTIPGCEIRESDNRDMMILVTDTPDARREEALQEKLKSIPSIQCMAMTFAHLEDAAQAGGCS